MPNTAYDPEAFSASDVRRQLPHNGSVRIGTSAYTRIASEVLQGWRASGRMFNSTPGSCHLLLDVDV